MYTLICVISVEFMFLRWRQSWGGYSHEWVDRYVLLGRGWFLRALASLYHLGIIQVSQCLATRETIIAR